MVRAAKKRRSKRAAAEPAASEESNGESEAAPEADADADSQPDWSVGDAVEAVRRALGPFDAGTRRKVVRAALTFLK